MSDGRIVTGDLLSGPVRTLLPGATGRAHPRPLLRRPQRASGPSATCRSRGPVVWAVDAATGAIGLRPRPSPGGGFHNDLVVTGLRVYVTDSRRRPAGRGDLSTRTGPPERPPRHPRARRRVAGERRRAPSTPTGSASCRTVRSSSTTAESAACGRSIATTGVATTIPVQGGPGIIGGDGLEIDGTILYNVRGSGPNQVSVAPAPPVRNRAGRPSGHGARSRRDPRTCPRRRPLAGGWLWVSQRTVRRRQPRRGDVLDHPAPGEVAGSRSSAQSRVMSAARPPARSWTVRPSPPYPSTCPRYSRRPASRQQRVVDRDDLSRRHPSHEADRLGDLAPRRVERDGQHVDLAGLAVVGVAGVVERRFAVRLQHHADVGAPRHAVVVDGVQPPDRADRRHPDAVFLALGEDDDVAAVSVEQLGRLGVGVDRRLSVERQQRRQPLLVEVVGVLMGDDDRVEVAERARSRSRRTPGR